MRWHTILGRCIHTSPSGYKVYENPIYRWLTLNSSILQTMIKKRNPQKALLYYLPSLTLMARAFPGTTCLLGLGGASVAHMLSSNSNKLTIVDISQEIIDIANQFFMLERVDNVTVIQKSAECFLREEQEQYSHVLVDLYDAHNFPKECKNDEFFKDCKDRIKPGGFLAVNLANYKDQLPISGMMQKHFKNMLIVPVNKCANMVIIASNDYSNEEFTQKMYETKEINKISLVDGWGYVGSMF